jgi:putative tryptophan/tyrosine transport system substrate-binding protein
VRRRAFVAGGAAVLGPWRAAAQRPSDRARRIVVLPIRSDLAARRVAAFEGGLRALGRSGEDMQVEVRLVEANRDMMRAAARDVAAVAPEIVVTQSTPMTEEMRAATRAIPIVFVHVSDPIGSGVVANFTRPGGNATGFTDTEASLGAKWLELLKEMAPLVADARLLFNPDTAPGRGEFFLGPFTAAGLALGVKTAPAAVRSGQEIEAALHALAAAGGGLVVSAETFTSSRSAQIVTLAARLGLPVVYPSRLYVAAGGLVSYGVDSPDLFRRAADYVDRILKGTRPADLPVQQPTKFELVVNLKTARTLGLTVPPSLLARADEVIE